MELEKISCMTKVMASELRKNGITSVEALTIHGLSELKMLIDKGHMINVWFDDLKAAYEEALRLKGLWLVTADQIETVRGPKLKFSTGSKVVDEMLGGGIFSREVTEFAGDYGCISGDTLVAVGNGELKPIRKIAEEAVGYIREGVYPINLKVQSINFSTKRLKRVMADKLHIYKCDRLLKIRTESGKEVSVTKNHPLYVFRRGWMEAEKLKVGDKIKTFKKISCIYRPNNSLHYNKDFETFCGILGFLIAEGWEDHHGHTNRITVANKNIKVLEEFGKMIKSLFNVNPKIVQGNISRCVINSKHLHALLKPYMPHATEKRAPDFVLEAEPLATANFLRWLFEGDGHVSYHLRRRTKTIKDQTYNYDEATRCVGYTTKSKTLALQIQQMLLKFGIASTIHERNDGTYRLNIREQRSLKRFAEMIGFVDEEKNTKLRALVNSYKNKRRHAYSSFEKIVSIDEVPNPEGFVYDLTVPSTNCFYTNGILSHNSGKTTFLFTILVEALGSNKDATAIFLDTEDTFDEGRVSTIARNRGYQPEDILKRTVYIPITDSDFMLEIVDRLHITIEAKNVKLILIDSLMAVLRAEFVGRDVLWYRQQLLNKMLRRLLNIAKVYNIAIVVSNQVVTNPQAQFTYDPIQQKVPTGGTVLGHNANTRIYLRKGKGSKRIVRLFDSNRLPEAECTVKIGLKGIEDITGEEKEDEGES